MLSDLLERGCVSCPTVVPQCSGCSANQQCEVVLQSCSACAVAQCVDISSSNNTSNSGGVSAGALAGGIVGALIFLTITVLLYLFYRRRSRARKAAEAALEPKPDIPVSAETVLSRPDPIEKALTVLSTPSPHADQSPVKLYPIAENSANVVDPQVQASTPLDLRRQSTRGSVQSNPFADGNSIQTADNSTISTNVIPIALVPHGSISMPADRPLSQNQSQSSSQPTIPSRPARSPDLNIRLDPLHSMNLDHVNVSDDSLRAPRANYAQSQISRITGASSRMSYMTTGSFTSDILSDAPQIVNVSSSSGPVRQIITVARPAVIRTPGSPLSSGLQTPTSHVSKAPVRSPLAHSAYSSSEYADEDGGQDATVRPTSFNDGQTPQAQSSTTSNYHDELSNIVDNTTAEWLQHDWDGGHGQRSGMDTRPSSIATIATQAGSIIADIGSATRVHIGGWPVDSPISPYIPNQRAQYRMTSARLVSPASSPLSSGEDGGLQERQMLALAHAQAKAKAATAAQGSPGPSRRVSQSSVASAGGDSVLAGFTFVPPSPIASRPPRSPLGKQNFNARNYASYEDDSELLAPQANAQTQRQQHGLSTASQASGLAGYTFRIGSGAMTNSETASLPSRNSQRASLDTLALTQDLSAFPLNFDQGGRDSYTTQK